MKQRKAIIKPYDEEVFPLPQLSGGFRNYPKEPLRVRVVEWGATAILTIIALIIAPFFITLTFIAYLVSLAKKKRKSPLNNHKPKVYIL